MEDELTEAMHGELSISKATEIKHRVFTALLAIDNNIFNRADAAEAYGVTDKQIRKHEAEYRKLQE
jgi:hypothetical protein